MIREGSEAEYARQDKQERSCRFGLLASTLKTSMRLRQGRSSCFCGDFYSFSRIDSTGTIAP
jgi:hypothetical protein